MTAVPLVVPFVSAVAPTVPAVAPAVPAVIFSMFVVAFGMFTVIRRRGGARLKLRSGMFLGHEWPPSRSCLAADRRSARILTPRPRRRFPSAAPSV